MEYRATTTVFVLLEHDTRDAVGLPAGERGVHWDFLLEIAGHERLATWRLAANPLTTAAEIPAQRIRDHRREYLDLEGAVSGGRGMVTRLDRGQALAARLEGDEVVVRVAGQHLTGSFELRRVDGVTLVFRRSPTNLQV